MGETTTVASQPIVEEGMEMRASRNFCVNQLMNKGKLKWHVISAVGDECITFDVKQVDPDHTYPVRFEHITDGAVTEYLPYRNLYISNPQNASGYFMVRVEVCEA